MVEVIKTPGAYIEYATTDKSIIFGDDDLSVNLKNREMDEKITIDICTDKNGFLVIGAETGSRYAAQVEIPARRYEETENGFDEEGYPITARTAIPFDINRCIIYLWGRGTAV